MTFSLSQYTNQTPLGSLQHSSSWFQGGRFSAGGEWRGGEGMTGGEGKGGERENGEGRKKGEVGGIASWLLGG